MRHYFEQFSNNVQCVFVHNFSKLLFWVLWVIFVTLPSLTLLNKMDEMKLLQRRQKKRHRRRPLSILSSNFEDHYTLSGHQLGSGAFSRVEECFKRRQKGPAADLIYAVKIIEKVQGFYSRPQILGEIDTYHLCQGHPHIIQLLQYFEDTHHFHLIFEKF